VLTIDPQSCIINAWQKELKAMQFVTVRDFRSASRDVWDKLSRDGELVVTNNGKPAALLLDIGDGDPEEILMSIRQSKAIRAYNRLRAQAAERGPLSEGEIDAEIQAARDEYKEKHGKSL